MKRWFAYSAIAVIAFALFIFVRYQFVSNDSWSTWNLPLSGKVIVVDAGHGGIDGGASSKSGILEKDVTLKIAKQLRDYLQEAGALVIMTRETDRDLADENIRRIRERKVQDLKKRVDIINNSSADLFVSIHLNAIPSPKWRGAQTFYNRTIEENEKIAKFIQSEIRRNLENTNRVARPIGNVYLLKKAKIPGVLVEAGFLSNEEEALLLGTEKYQQKVAATIYQGILRYFADEPVPEE